MNDPEVSDAELARLIASAGQGAEVAEAALYRRFARRIELYGLRHLGSRTAAEDLVQQVIVSVLSAVRDGRLQNPESLAGFVLGTCRNLASDARRRARKQRELEREGPGGDVVTWPPSLHETDVARLFGCMRALPERDATVVRMSFWEDRAAEEISERLGVSTGNVRVIRHRAIVKLAECLRVRESLQDQEGS
jgi:RNA polymerase sigma-70 factor (ECF subfamily)